jgi:hypothetical protein
VTIKTMSAIPRSRLPGPFCDLDRPSRPHKLILEG